MANFERLRAVLDWAEEQERTNKFVFDMQEWVSIFSAPAGAKTVQPFKGGVWSCNTSACLAGSAAIYAGMKVQVNDSGSGAFTSGTIIDPERGERVANVEEWAQDYFELTYDEKEEIFFTGAYSVREMKQYINEYFNEEVFPDVEWVKVELEAA